MDYNLEKAANDLESLMNNLAVEKKQLTFDEFLFVGIFDFLAPAEVVRMQTLSKRFWNDIVPMYCTNRLSRPLLNSMIPPQNVRPGAILLFQDD